MFVEIGDAGKRIAVARIVSIRPTGLAGANTDVVWDIGGGHASTVDDRPIDEVALAIHNALYEADYNAEYPRAMARLDVAGPVG